MTSDDLLEQLSVPLPSVRLLHEHLTLDLLHLQTLVFVLQLQREPAEASASAHGAKNLGLRQGGKNGDQQAEAYDRGV